MICKLVTHGKDRSEATRIMVSALENYIIHGIRTNIGYLMMLLQNTAFAENRISTGFCDRHTADIVEGIKSAKENIPQYIPVLAFLLSDIYGKARGMDGSRNIWTRAGFWRNRMEIRMNFEETPMNVHIPICNETYFEAALGERIFALCEFRLDGGKVQFTLDSEIHSAWVSSDRENNACVTVNGHIYSLKRTDILAESELPARVETAGADADHVTSPMPGKVIKIGVSKGDKVTKGDLLLIVEAMKMENKVVAPRDGIVDEVNVAVNDRVEVKTQLVTLEKESATFPRLP